MEIHGDIFRLGGYNYDETCVARGVTVQIDHAEPVIRSNVRITKGATLTIKPPIDGEPLSSAAEYEIRSATGSLQFRPSQIETHTIQTQSATVVKVA